MNASQLRRLPAARFRAAALAVALCLFSCAAAALAGRVSAQAETKTATFDDAGIPLWSEQLPRDYYKSLGVLIDPHPGKFLFVSPQRAEFPTSSAPNYVYCFYHEAFVPQKYFPVTFTFVHPQTGASRPTARVSFRTTRISSYEDRVPRWQARVYNAAGSLLEMKSGQAHNELVEFTQPEAVIAKLVFTPDSVVPHPAGQVDLGFGLDTLQFDVPEQLPEVSNPDAEPDLLGKQFGLNTVLSIQARSPLGIRSAEAEVKYPDQRTSTINLSLAAGSDTEGTWAAAFTADPNKGQSQADYEVRFRAVDVGGTVSAWSSTIRFSVMAQADRLQVAVLQDCGSVELGRESRRGQYGRLSVTNISTEPVLISGINACEPEFTVYSGPTPPVHLQPNQEFSYQVVFRPLAAGARQCLISVSSSVGQVAANRPITGTGIDDTGPRLRSPRATPRSVRPGGGAVTFSVDVDDPGGVSQVSAQVSRSDGAAATLAFTRTSGDAYRGSYQVGYTLQAPVRGSFVYRIFFSATDSSGNLGRARSSLRVTVRAPRR
jgi:hypothetical protein